MGNETYRPRIADKLLANKLDAMGAVLIEEAKWCGKTATAEQAGGQAGGTLSLTWLRAEKPPYSALISGFEHILSIIMEKLDFQRHFSILSPKLCFFSWIRAEFRMKYALPDGINKKLSIYEGAGHGGRKFPFFVDWGRWADETVNFMLD